MTKKSIVIEILEKIKSERRPAEGFLALLKLSTTDEDTTNALIDLIQKTLENAKDLQENQILKKSIGVLEKIKEQEIESLIHDQEDMEELLSELENV